MSNQMKHRASKSMQKSFQASTMDTKTRFRAKEVEVNVLDQKGLEKWINEILLEASHKDLKKLGLDRKALRSIGLVQDEITRIYRCLFVYTFGFYQMLHDMTKNQLVTTQIWKVFAVLLQYTSKEEFAFTLNTIQQEHKNIVNKLHESLILKETQIQNFESLQQQLKDRLLQDLMVLQEQTVILQKQKDEFEQDFKSANIAFEDEVAMRVRFEFKINEIHSIYRELQLKYKKSVDELGAVSLLYDKSSNELTRIRKLYDQTVGQLQAKEMDLGNLQSQIDQLHNKLAEREKLLKDHELQRVAQQMSQIHEFSSLKNQEHHITSLKMQLQELQAQHINNLQIIEMNKSDLDDCKRLNLSLLNELQQTKETLFTTQNESFKQQIQIEQLTRIETGLRNQIQVLQLENEGLLNENSRIMESHKKLEVDLQFTTQKAEVYSNEILILNQNIQQMKNVKIMLDEEFIKERVKVQQLQNSITTKEDVILDLEKCLGYSQQRLHTLTLEITDLENKQRIVQQENTMQQQALSKKIEFLQQCLENERQEIINEKDKYESLTTQFDIQKRELTDLRNQFKVMVFENNNLITKQIFLNRVIDNERLRNTELINETTQGKLEYENLKREFRTLEARFGEQHEQLAKEKQYLIRRYENRIKDFKDQIKELGYQMRYEDLLSAFVRMHDTMNQVRIENAKFKRENNILLSQNAEFQAKVNQYKEKLKTLRENLSETENLAKVSTEKIGKFKLIFKIKQQQLDQLKMESEDQYSTISQLQSTITSQQQHNQQLQEENLKQKQLIKRYRQTALSSQADDNNGEQSTQRKNLNLNQPVSQNDTQFRGRSNTKKTSQIYQKDGQAGTDLQHLQNLAQSTSNAGEHESGATEAKQPSIPQPSQQPTKRASIMKPQNLSPMSNSQVQINMLVSDMKQLPTIQPQNQSKPVMRDSIRIKEDLLQLSLNDFSTVQPQVVKEEQSGQSRSISSRKSSARPSAAKVIQPQTTRQRRSIESKQFARLYQFASQHYQH